MDSKSIVLNVCLCFSFSCYISFANAISPWVCDYYLADSKGWDMNKLAASIHETWLLHGAWNKKGTNDSCLSYERFLELFHPIWESEEIFKRFLDGSPKTKHSCCRTQWHEYNKHGCQAGNSYDEWLAAIRSCLNSFEPKKLYPRRCRYDYQINCNFPDEVADTQLPLQDCRKGKPFCHTICFEECFSVVCNAVIGKYTRPHTFKYQFLPNFHEHGEEEEFGEFICLEKYSPCNLTANNEPVVTVANNELTSITSMYTSPTLIPNRTKRELNCTCFPDSVGDEEIPNNDRIAWIKVKRDDFNLMTYATIGLNVYCDNDDNKIKKLEGYRSTYKYKTWERQYKNLESESSFDVSRIFQQFRDVSMKNYEVMVRYGIRFGRRT